MSIPTIDDIRNEVNQRESDLVHLVQRLVRIPSVTGEEGAVQRVVAEEMRALGLDVDVWNPTLQSSLPMPSTSERSNRWRGDPTSLEPGPVTVTAGR